MKVARLQNLARRPFGHESRDWFTAAHVPSPAASSKVSRRVSRTTARCSRRSQWKKPDRVRL